MTYPLISACATVGRSYFVNCLWNSMVCVASSLVPNAVNHSNQCDAVSNTRRTGGKCLRHHAGEDSKCEGYGENSCHTLSEYLLSHAIGEKMLLPAIGARDGVPPHVSRYTENGACRVGWANRPRDCSELDRFLTAQARFFRAGLAVFLIWCLLVAYVLFECFQWCTAAAGGVVAGRP